MFQEQAQAYSAETHAQVKSAHHGGKHSTAVMWGGAVHCQCHERRM